MSWFKRSEKGIHTKTEEKKDIPKGLWYQTPTGKIIEAKELAENKYVSPEDDYHVHIGSKEYFEILFDNNVFEEFDKELKSKDFLKFEDSKKYINRLKDAHKKTGLYDAIRTAVGPSKGKNIVIACMDFRFIGGSMGSVVGEKISRATDYAIKNKLPVVIHTRNSFEEAIKIVERFNDNNLSGVFHCFSGDLKEAERIIALGNFYLGIGGVVTFKNGGIDKFVNQIDLDHILLETDSPYLAPTPFRGKRNESKYIINIAEKLSEIYGISTEKISEITTSNAYKLFKL